MIRHPNDPLLVHISEWLDDLRAVVRPKHVGRITPDQAEELASETLLYANLLAMDFPAAAFTFDAMHATVRGCEWFPTYEHIRSKVAEWWRDHQPIPTMITGPAGCVLSATDAAGLRNYRKRWQELLKTATLPNRDTDPARYEASPFGRLDSFTRQYYPGAWEVIAGERPAEPDAVLAAKAAETVRLVKQAALDRVMRLPPPEPFPTMFKPRPVHEPELQRLREARGITAQPTGGKG